MATLGHVHIKVKRLDEAEAFYTRFLGLNVAERIGNHYSFLSSGKLHHELALQAIGANAPMPSRHSVGLFHTAFEVSSKEAFAEIYRALKIAKIPAFPTNHRISWALYFSDPSGNGVEVYLDTRNELEGSQTWDGLDRPLGEEEILSVLQVAI